MDLEALEQQVIVLLTDEFPDLDVKLYPDDFSTYTIVNQTGEILVQFVYDEFSQPEGTGTIVQKDTLMLDLTIMTPNRRGTNGVNDLISRIRNCITGLCLNGGLSPLFLSEVLFLQYKDSTWAYSSQWITSYIYSKEVQDVEYTINEVIITGEENPEYY